MSEPVYTLFSVFRKGFHHCSPDPDSLSPAQDLLADFQAAGVFLRGFYDVSAFRADADLMLWLYSDAAASLQAAHRSLRRLSLFRGLAPSWSAMGLHRPAEFKKEHVPGYLRGEPARAWLTVYPFVRSYDWYLLPPEKRSAMLADHGHKGAKYRGVVANTVSSFALGDYEWLLPMEANELVELVDMMRELRDTEARLHVREEKPFYTGRRIEIDEVLEVLA